MANEVIKWEEVERQRGSKVLDGDGWETYRLKAPRRQEMGRRKMVEAGRRRGRRIKVRKVYIVHVICLPYVFSYTL